MSGDFAPSQSLGPTARKRYFPNSKAATGVMVATNRARAPRRWQTLEEILWGCFKVFGSEKFPEFRAIRGAEQ
jgi:hypothetical protein